MNNVWFESWDISVRSSWCVLSNFTLFMFSYFTITVRLFYLFLLNFLHLVWLRLGLTRLRLGLSHLNEHRFNHNFKNCINPLCTCSLEVESISHFFLCCHYYDSIRHMFNELSEVDVNLPNASDEKLVNILLYESSLFSYSQNWSILNSSVRYIINSNRFSGSIF